MRHNIRLTEQQRELAVQHLRIVEQVIRRYRMVREDCCGMGYFDLFQEGCCWLCQAAGHYQEERGISFASYAYTVVRNGLYSYCSMQCQKQKGIGILVDIETIGRVVNKSEEVFEECELFDMLQRLEKQYTGTVRHGIEAMKWRAKGFSASEIAAIYGVRSNLVSAWIARARQRLARDPAWREWLEDHRLTGRKAS